MEPITLSIDPAVADRLPELTSGGFAVEGLGAARVRLQPEQHLREATKDLAGQGLTVQNLVQHPSIAAWRRAIAECGLKPSTFKSSPEQLGRRLLASAEISTPLPLVNLYCAVSARHLAPLGAYDRARLPSYNLQVRHADPDRDRFCPMGGRTEQFPLTSQVVVYAAGPTIICWGFNCRDSRDSCLTQDTEDALILGEAATSAQHAPLVDALGELAGLLEEAGARVGPLTFTHIGSPPALFAWPSSAQDPA